MATGKQDAISLLTEDHRKVEGLFKQFEKASGEGKKRQLAEEICMELTIHTKIEEDIFYPACKGAVDEDSIKEAYVEHDGAKVLIAEIEAGGPDDSFYEAKVKVLREMIEHHVEEEEKGADSIFGQVKKSDIDVKELGQRLAEEKQQLMKEYEEDGVPTPETKTLETTKLG
jgi:hypothetical protein